jgi:hypothetical protein
MPKFFTEENDVFKENGNTEIFFIFCLLYSMF